MSVTATGAATAAQLDALISMLLPVFQARERQYTLSPGEHATAWTYEDEEGDELGEGRTRIDAALDTLRRLIRGAVNEQGDLRALRDALALVQEEAGR